MSDHWHYDVEVAPIAVPRFVDIEAEESEVFRLGSVFRKSPVHEALEVLRSSWAKGQGWMETAAGKCFERPISDQVRLLFVVEDNDIRLIRRAQMRVQDTVLDQSRQVLSAAVRDSLAIANEHLHQVVTRTMLVVNRKQAARLGSIHSIAEDWSEADHRVRQTIRMHIAGNVRDRVAAAT